jgi:hypothetical protein
MKGNAGRGMRSEGLYHLYSLGIYSKRSRVCKEVVGGFLAYMELMYTICCVTSKLLACSAVWPRRKFFSARSGDWTSLVHFAQKKFLKERSEFR